MMQVWTDVPSRLLGYRRLYLDMDGVLADFDTHHRNTFGYERERHTGWSHIYPGWFRSMPPMPDMSKLITAVAHLNPIVLTGTPRSVNMAGNEKVEWVKANIGAGVGVICCPAREKRLYCRPGDILVDDSAEHRALWEGAGGVWVQHTSADDTIRELGDLGVL